MKVTLEPGGRQFVSGGVPMRLWRGVTEDGVPVLAAVVGLAVPAGGMPDDTVLEPAQEPPIAGVGPNGRTVIAGRDGKITFGWWWV